MLLEVHGTVQRPRLVLRSDPPVYSEAQLIAIIVSGDPSEQRTGQNLEQRAMSAISSLIVSQVKDRLMTHLPFDVLKVAVDDKK